MYVFTCFYHWSLGPPIIFLVIEKNLRYQVVMRDSNASQPCWITSPAALPDQDSSLTPGSLGDPRRHGYTQKTMEMMKDAPSFDRSIR